MMSSPVAGLANAKLEVISEGHFSFSIAWRAWLLALQAAFYNERAFFARRHPIGGFLSAMRSWWTASI
jgi:hypothetical protein